MAEKIWYSVLGSESNFRGIDLEYLICDSKKRWSDFISVYIFGIRRNFVQVMKCHLTINIPCFISFFTEFRQKYQKPWWIKVCCKFVLNEVKNELNNISKCEMGERGGEERARGTRGRESKRARKRETNRKKHSKYLLNMGN